MKLYATLETNRGKVVSVSDNESITATVYDGNMKAYSVIIEWCNVGDIEKPTMGAIVTTREWRNEPNERRKKKKQCNHFLVKDDYGEVYCQECGKYNPQD